METIQIVAKGIFTCVAGYALIAVVLRSPRAEVRALTEFGIRDDTALFADRVAMTHELGRALSRAVITSMVHRW